MAKGLEPIHELFLALFQMQATVRIYESIEYQTSIDKT